MPAGHWRPDRPAPAGRLGLAACALGASEAPSPRPPGSGHRLGPLRPVHSAEARAVSDR